VAGQDRLPLGGTDCDLMAKHVGVDRWTRQETREDACQKLRNITDQRTPRTWLVVRHVAGRYPAGVMLRSSQEGFGNIIHMHEA
jgi:hypothetical protein